MSSRTSYGNGNVVSAQDDIFAAPTEAFSQPGVINGVIQCHGAQKVAKDVINPQYFGEYAIYNLLRHQYCVGVGDFEFTAWGNDTAIADIELMRLYMESKGAKTGKKAFVGASMGCVTALNYAMAHPTQVSCVVCTIPAIGPLSNPALSTSFQNAVKSGASYSESVDGPMHNPQNAIYQANFPRDIPVKLWYSNGDLTAYSSQVLAFAAAVPNATAVKVSNTLDHSQDAIAAAPLNDIMSFIAAGNW